MVLQWFSVLTLTLGFGWGNSFPGKKIFGKWFGRCREAFCAKPQKPQVPGLTMEGAMVSGPFGATMGHFGPLFWKNGATEKIMGPL